MRAFLWRVLGFAAEFAREGVAVLALVVLLSFVLPGWVSVLLFAGWLVWDGCGGLSYVAEQRIAHVSSSALVTWRVPWSRGLAFGYAFSLLELLTALGLVLWVLIR